MQRQLVTTALNTMFVALLAATQTTPAAAEWDVDGIEELLPRHETAAERERWRGREASMPARGTEADPPPLAPVRNCAEWEPATGVLIRYPLGLPYNLLRDFDDDVTLHVIVSSAYLTSAQTNLAANGVDMGRVEFLEKANDSIWTRDYGPWFAFDGSDELTIIDHVYNRPFRPNDNLIPIYFGQQQSIPVVSHDMWHTGGNYMTDGAHISSSTHLVYAEAASANGMTPAEVDQLMGDYYGVQIYQVLDYIESSGIHHIDTWAKFLDEETVLLKEVWPAHQTYAALEQRATLLASLIASTGRTYRVFRVYCHDIGSGRPASYTNSLVLNRAIYVPTFGHATHDADALAAYEAAAPGYTVRGYAYGGWLTDDALHCRAKGVMDRDMLRVAHIPIVDNQVGEVVVEATIKDHSGAGVSVAEVTYRQDGQGWEQVAMTLVAGDVYAATLPEPLADTQTDYYIHAESLSGRDAGMPRVEPARWYSFSHQRSSTAVAADAAAAGPVRLGVNRPNPFRASTVFRFELHHADKVRLAVYDAQGRLVRRLVDGERPAGMSEIPWDGRDERGRRVAAGVYYLRLQAAGVAYSRPAVVVD